MNFFDAQDRARRATRWLVLVYVIATLLIVAGVTALFGVALNVFGDGAGGGNPALLGAVAAATALFIIGASLYKTASLSGGGGRVARQLGGTPVPADVQDPLRQRLRNVVEEMSIASGVPVPEIYVLEAESGINAFAAGFTPGDAAVAVTRGTLELLDRDELQGVIAHEFSHILNGDMRLNIRLMGVLFGIMVLGLIGRTVLRGTHYGGFGSSRRSRGAPAIVIIALGMTILGWVGVFFSRLIKAAVSRQREFLADASAVQFTRQNTGIANALKKIGGYTEQSYFQAADPEEVSHMLFASGIRRLRSMFATHPPLTERIRALDPQFDETQFRRVEPQRESVAVPAEAVAGFDAYGSYGRDGDTPVDESIVQSIGNPGERHVEYARGLRPSIPETLYAAAHSPDGAYLLAVALVIDEAHEAAQLRIVGEQLGDARTGLVRRYVDEMQKIGPAYRLPLLEISFPVLKRRPPQQLEFLLALIRRLIEFDGRVDLREFCYYRVIARHLLQAADPSADRSGNRVSRDQARRAAVTLIRVLADQGHDSDAERERACRAGLAVFGRWARDVDKVEVSDEQSVAVLDRALDVLANINTAGRESLLDAVTETIAHDGRLSLEEAEMLRAICASLDCPLPPLLAGSPVR